MHNCLIKICKDFEIIKDFFKEQTVEKEELVNRLFVDFMLCFPTIKEEKLLYPKEFLQDVNLYNEGNISTIKKFQDVQMRYLMLSDFYDFARLTKKYKKT